LWIVNNINFQYFSILITIISAVVMVVVSYLTPEPNQPQIQGLTFATASAEDKARTYASADDRAVVTSRCLSAFLSGAYPYFLGEAAIVGSLPDPPHPLAGGWQGPLFSFWLS